MSAPKLASSKYIQVNLKITKDSQLASLAGLIDGAASLGDSCDRAVRKVRLVKSENRRPHKVDRYDVATDTAALQIFTVAPFSTPPASKLVKQR